MHGLHMVTSSFGHMVEVDYALFGCNSEPEVVICAGRAILLTRMIGQPSFEATVGKRLRHVML